MCRPSFSLWLVACFQTSVWAQWKANITPESRSLDEIYKAAEAENCDTLRIAAGGDAKQYWNSTIEGFNKRFPKINLNLTTDLSKYHDARIDRAFYAEDESIDIACLQTLHDYPRWKAQNRLLYYKPQNFSDIANAEKDFDGAYLPVYLFSFGQYTYNSGKISAMDVPTNYIDLLDPKWRGKLILTYPNDDDAIAYLFSIIVSKYGFTWLSRLAQQDVQWVRGTATPFLLLSQAIANTSSHRALSFTTTQLQGFSPLIQSKAPLQEEYMSWYQSMAIFQSTKCPESAKLFESWILSDEWQAPLSEVSNTVLTHLNTLSGREVFKSNTTQVDGFREFMRDRAGVEWWRVQFESMLGPPVGGNPNSLY